MAKLHPIKAVEKKINKSIMSAMQSKQFAKTMNTMPIINRNDKRHVNCQASSDRE